MTDMHLHVEGTPADHAEWAVEDEDDFDAAAMERAMLESRRHTYEALRTLDAA